VRLNESHRPNTVGQRNDRSTESDLGIQLCRYARRYAVRLLHQEPREHPEAPPTAEQLETARQLGELIADGYKIADAEIGTA